MASISFDQGVGNSSVGSPSFNQGVGNLNLQNQFVQPTNTWTRANTSFSGCDIRAFVHAVDPTTGVQSSPKQLGNIATLSYSIHREKFPVRTLGTTYPKAFTRGPRTIAGTLIFNVFDRYALWDILESKAATDRGWNEDSHSLLGDQITPFDITCTFVNELGITSQLVLYGVELVDEGQVMSINDIYIESTHSFVAKDIATMTPAGIANPTSLNPTLPNTTYQFDSATQSVQTPQSLQNIDPLRTSSIG